MEKQTVDQVVEHLLAKRVTASKADLRAVVELVQSHGSQVIAGYDEEGPYCGTRVPGAPPKIGGLIEGLSAKGIPLRLFPYGIIQIDEVLVKVGLALHE
jgi:hypothetical protein